MEDEQSSEGDDDDSESYDKRISDVHTGIECTFNTTNVETNVKSTEEHEIKDEYAVSSDNGIEHLTENDEGTQTNLESDLKESNSIASCKDYDVTDDPEYANIPRTTLCAAEDSSEYGKSLLEIEKFDVLQDLDSSYYDNIPGLPTPGTSIKDSYPSEHESVMPSFANIPRYELNIRRGKHDLHTTIAYDLLKSTIKGQTIDEYDIFQKDDLIETRGLDIMIDVNLKSLMYTLLLQYDYSFYLKNNFWMRKLNIIRHVMHLEQLGSYDEFYQRFRGIDSRSIFIDDRKVTFTNVKKRHVIMGSFIADILWNADNLEFFLLESSVTAISEYCRHEHYTKKPGERCVFIPKKYNDIFIKRLMELPLDLIIHPTVDDSDIRKAISAKVPFFHDVLEKSAIERKEIHKQLMEESTIITKRKYVWHEDWEEVIKSTLRSTFAIGNSEHWMYDVFATDKDIRTLQKVEHMNEDQWSILYTMILQKNYEIDLNDTQWIHTLNQIISAMGQPERSISIMKTENLPEKIVCNIQNKLRFTTNESRHNVMRSFIAHFLWKRENLDCFCLESSISALSEYCRHECYKIEPGEMCIFIPTVYEYMFLQRLKELQIDVIEHPIMADENIRKKICIEFPNFQRALMEKEKTARKEMNQKRKTNSHVLVSRSDENFKEMTDVDWLSFIQNITLSMVGRYQIDLFVINDEIRSTDNLRDIGIEQRCILYSLLFQYDYIVDLGDNHWTHTLRVIRIRMNLPENTSDKYIRKRLESLTGKFLKRNQNEITFESETMRHDACCSMIADLFVNSRDLEFFLRESSITAISEYCRNMGYETLKEERCIFLPNEQLNLFFERMQEEIFSHPIFLNFPEIRLTCLGKLHLTEHGYDKMRRMSRVIYIPSKEERFIGLKEIVKSTIGLDDVYQYDVFYCDHAVRTFQGKHLGMSINQRCFLYVHLFVEDYSVEFSTENWWLIFKKIHGHFRSYECPEKGEILREIKSIDEEIIQQTTTKSKLPSMDIQHDIMSSFIADILWREKNIPFFLENASTNVVTEYCVFPAYRRKKNERCIYIPKKYIDLMVDRIGKVHLIIHRMVDDETLHSQLADISKLPEEIFKWDFESRKRYFSQMKTGEIQIFRARGMIVGCAGAGKTTLLRRFKKEKRYKLNKVTSTVGMEVFYDIFVVDEKEMKFKKSKNQKQKDRTLTMMDFGGQCAYYACHQIYLTDRAFYLLVIDASKSYKDNVDEKVCDQSDTCFSDWTYGDYCVFWLKSIHTYCNEICPVFIIFTHCEHLNDKEIEELTDRFLDLFPKDSDLLKHLDRKRFFCIKIPKMGLILSLLKTLSQREIERGLVEVILKQQSWGETVPKTWLSFSNRLEDMMDLKMIALDNLKDETQMLVPPDDFFDVLRFYHESGRILYFDDNELKNHVILNVQWFVDAFKSVIADRKHVHESIQMDLEWREFYKTGVLKKNVLESMWNTDKSMDLLKEPGQRCILLLYMQRLGLLAKGKDVHYVPSMNKKNIDEKEDEYIKSVKCKSSILYFQFDFLPIFIFYRLIVSVLTQDQWERFTDDYEWVYKNMALFRFKQHCIILAVSDQSIQVQVFIEDSRQSNIEKDVTLKIRNNLEEKMNFLTKTFHRNLSYSIGYSCKQVEICKDPKDLFIPEKDLLKGSHLNERPCPRRHRLGEDHTLMAYEIMWPWTKLVWENESKRIEGKDSSTENVMLKTQKRHKLFSPVLSQDETFSLETENGDEKAVNKKIQDEEKHFRCFSTLVDIGTEALRMVFDKMVPSSQLGKFLHDNEDDMRKGRIRFNNSDLSVLFPCNKTVSSFDMDIPMLYKLIRNFLDIDAPAGGWGKPLMTDDLSIAADMERVRLHRNYVTHDTSKKLHPDVFQQRWLDLSLAIQRLSNGNLKRRIERILKEP